ncbi:MAG: ABC transporter ATP-binding protein [Holophagales bacterium]|nr:ABC transporter ATP-binding protein [Holophagales bacterium]
MSPPSNPPLRLVFRYLRRQKWLLSHAVFWRGVYELAPMQIPVLTGVVVDILTSGEASLLGHAVLPGHPERALVLAVGGLGLLALFHGVSSYLRTTTTARLSRSFVSDMRISILSTINSMSLDGHRGFGSAELLQRSLIDTRRLRIFLQRVFIEMLLKMVRAGYPIVMLLILDWRLAMAALSILPAQILGTRSLQKRLLEATLDRRSSETHLIEAVKENLDGIETIQSLNAGDQMVSKTVDRSNELELNELAADRITASLSGLVWLTTGLGLALTWSSLRPGHGRRRATR